MGLGDDARYRSLARRAAGKLGTSADAIVNAILAQWQCELGAGDAYPPRRNNPGNLAAGAAKSIGARYSVEPGSNPQPGNPIVTFPSPEAGADAYGKLLASLGRYAPVRAAVVHRDGRAFLQAINASGYGGSLSCTLSVFGGAPANSSVGGGGLPGLPGPSGTVVVSSPTSTLAAELKIDPGTPVTVALVDQAAHQIASRSGIPNRSYPIIDGDLRAYLAAHPGITAGAFPLTLQGGRAPGLGSDLTVPDVVGDLFGGLFGWVPGVAANLAVLVGIGALGYVGLRMLADGLGEG